MITPPKPNMVHLKITPLKRKLIFHPPPFWGFQPLIFQGATSLKLTASLVLKKPLVWEKKRLSFLGVGLVSGAFAVSFRERILFGYKRNRI